MPSLILSTSIIPIKLWLYGVIKDKIPVPQTPCSPTQVPRWCGYPTIYWFAQLKRVHYSDFCLSWMERLRYFLFWILILLMLTVFIIAPNLHFYRCLMIWSFSRSIHVGLPTLLNNNYNQELKIGWIECSERVEVVRIKRVILVY